jgi:hypothetical protein
MDEKSKMLRDAEWKAYLRERRREAWIWVPKEEPVVPEDLTGIALSGGGIRSATFALGVLQALAQHKLLRRFDYLSTVSGGGYIGSSLTWLTSQAALEAAQAALAVEAGVATPALPIDGFGLEPADNAGAAPSERPFPYGTDDPRTARDPERLRAEGAMLRYLRQHGNYLPE